ncbi:MAG: GatB/YqeY domain-containing protein [Bacteroidota bacterium]|nr:GatB/YqeY domain-containing protein [Bacillota bacterium]MDP4290829.1 GatB/YqeY domain-containing protein [Bacteroidota bacterium]
MELEKLINNDIKQAMLAKDKETLEALRAIKAALLLEKTGKDVSSGEIPETVELKMLQKLVKQRRESAQIYVTQGRQDLADQELFQAKIIEKYLPAQMSEEDIKAIIVDIIARVGAKEPKDLGKVMGPASKELAGKADNKTISAIIKTLLEG